jgi:uncharacterized protein (TIGR03435 family)
MERVATTNSLPRSVGLFAILFCGTWAFGQTGGGLKFDVCSIKPTPPAGSRPSTTSDPLTYSRHASALAPLIAWAYSLPEYQVSGGPSWVTSDRFDIEAKSAIPASVEQMREMLRNLLADRFKVAVHREAGAIRAYALTVDKGGPKLGPQIHATAAGEPYPAGKSGVLVSRGSLKQFASTITIYLKVQFPAAGQAPLIEPEPLAVVDQTNLAGSYDITVDMNRTRDWFVVLEEQLGLKLQARKIPMEMLVIDKAEKPSEN